MMVSQSFLKSLTSNEFDLAANSSSSLILLLYIAEQLTLYIPTSGTVSLKEVKRSSTHSTDTPVTIKKSYQVIIVLSCIISKNVHTYK